MSTPRLTFPVPDERARLFVNNYADMHDLVEDLLVLASVPDAAATVLRTARELLLQSYYCYKFSTVAVMHSLIAVEIVLRDRIPDAGKKPLHQLIKQGAADAILTARQAEYQEPQGGPDAPGAVADRTPGREACSEALGEEDGVGDLDGFGRGAGG